MGNTATIDQKQWTSRAVLRPVEAGNFAECPRCLERLVFKARHREQQVICNVYHEGAWQRVEHYHIACYHDAGEPYGAPTEHRS